MHVVPVLDIKDGIVVRGIGGRRSEYRPIVSQLTDSCNPLTVAQSFRDQFELSEIYLADLDAITGQPPALPVFAELRSRGFRLWIDAGVRDLRQARLLADASTERIVLGLETVTGPDVLRQACSQLSGARIVFSLDLKNGQPLGDLSKWESGDPYSIALQAIDNGVRNLLVLDLAQVGEGRGLGTLDLCARLKEAHPEIQLTAGGGVRGTDDLRALKECGVDAVLIASALHDGRIRSEELRELALRE